MHSLVINIHIYRKARKCLSQSGVWFTLGGGRNLWWAGHVGLLDWRFLDGSQDHGVCYVFCETVFGAHVCMHETYSMTFKNVFYKQLLIQVQQWNECYVYFLECSMDENLNPAVQVHILKRPNAQNSQVKLLSFMLWTLITFFPGVWKVSRGENSSLGWCLILLFCLKPLTKGQKGINYFIYFSERRCVLLS